MMSPDETGPDVAWPGARGRKGADDVRSTGRRVTCCGAVADGERRGHTHTSHDRRDIGIVRGVLIAEKGIKVMLSRSGCGISRHVG